VPLMKKFARRTIKDLKNKNKLKKGWRLSLEPPVDLNPSTYMQPLSTGSHKNTQKNKRFPSKSKYQQGTPSKGNSNLHWLQYWWLPWVIIAWVNTALDNPLHYGKSHAHRGPECCPPVCHLILPPQFQTWKTEIFHINSSY